MVVFMSKLNNSETIHKLENLTDSTCDIIAELLGSNSTGSVPDVTVQKLLLASVRLYANKIDNENRSFAAIPNGEIATATEVAVVVNELMMAADLNMFDLAMWSGRRQPNQEI
jgi:hypothetical protein